MALYGIIAFVIYGWVEFEAMAHVVDGIGGLLAFLGIFATALIGIRLLRSQSALVMAQFRADLAKGQMNSQAIASSLSLLIGAILMLLPGYVTDGLGLLCFVPGLRALIGGFIARHINLGMMSSMRGPFGAGFSQTSSDNPFASQDEFETQQKRPSPPHLGGEDDVIEGEFKEKK